MATLATTPPPPPPTTTNCIDLNKFSATLCSIFQQIVFDRMDKTFEEKIDDIGKAKLRNARAQFWLIAEKFQHAVHEQCRQLAEQCNETLVDSARSRGPSFVIGDDSSSTTSATPSIASSGVHSAACCSDEGVQVDLPPSERRNSLATVGSASANATPAAAAAQPQRHTQQQIVVVKTERRPPAAVPMSHDALLLAELRQGMLKHRMLEQRCAPAKAVELRRRHLEDHHHMGCLQLLPFKHYDYSEVKDACCENVIGFVPLPTGVAGPLYFDGTLVHLPLATTEGALVASVSRGCLSINESISMLGHKAFSVHVFRDGMSRAPVLEFPFVRDAIECLQWIQQNETFMQLKQIFEETSNYACLQRIDAHLEGTYLYLRFVASTGDAMGMNMITKGTGRALSLIKQQFPQGTLVSISGNLCVDKKPSALNWIEGRGKSVVAEALIPAQIVERVLRTNVDKMVKLGHAKLLIGSSAAVTVGGWNAHAANVVAAMFLATGQDAAQVVSSSMCLTQLQRRTNESGISSLHITCTMNCLEVGTVGGGTMLTPQGACLEMLACRQAGLRPGQNAERFARLVCAAVLAGELSLLASQCTEGDLEKSHLRLNRSSRSLALNLTGGGSGKSSVGNSPQHNAAAPPLPYSLTFRSPSGAGGGIGGCCAMREIPEHSPLLSHNQRLTQPPSEGILCAERDTVTLLTAASSTYQRRKEHQQQQQQMQLQRHHQRRDGTITSTATTTASSVTNAGGGGGIGSKLRKIGQMCEPL